MNNESQQIVEKYIRLNITKNSRGYGYETTISLRWTGEIEVADELDRLHAYAADEAFSEIEAREGRDAQLEAA